MVTLSAVSVTTLCSTTSVRAFSWDCQYLQSSCCWHLPFPGSSLGKPLWAVKSTQSAATKKVSFIAGIKIERVKIFVYAITGFFCALAGAVLTSRLNSAQPTAGTGYELDAIAAVVLGGTSLSGGKGYITGTLVGVLIIGTLNNGLNILDVSSFYQQVVKGIVIYWRYLWTAKKLRRHSPMKKIWTLLVAAITVLAVLTSGCGSSDKAAKPADGKKTTTIGFSISTLNNPFFVSVRKGVEEEAKKLGVNVKIVDAQNDPAKQANDISDLIQQKVDVLLINPVDSAAVSTSVAAANKASIPVLALDRSADKGTVPPSSLLTTSKAAKWQPNTSSKNLVKK